MKIDILTLFPNMFSGPFDESLIKRALKNKLAKINIHNLRDWATDKHHTVDDTPYGGGAGMVIKVDVIEKALSDIVRGTKVTKTKKPNSSRSPLATSNGKPHIILLSPQGKVFNQNLARQFSKNKHLIFICGHYEGFDERIKEHLIDEEISIGDYVLTGGELPAMVLVDAIVRLIPGVVGKQESIEHESFGKLTVNSKQLAGALLDYPTYTKPVKYKNWKVPEVLLSGDHQKVEEWRKKMSLKNTKQKRPDLIEK